MKYSRIEKQNNARSGVDIPPNGMSGTQNV